MREPELQSAVSKVKWRILPLFVVMFIVNYIDRVNISFIKEQLGSELGIGDLAYGFGAGLFFWGYALLEVPANLALERLGARRWLTIIAVTWGLLATGLAFVRNEYEFYALRFALGAAEAGFFPGVVYYFTRWLPSAERGKAMAIFLSGSAIATIISGPLSSYLLQLSVPGLQPWQWMIVFEGAFSVLMAGVLWLLLDSHISDARWLTPGERTSLEQTLEAERARSARPGPVDKLALLTSPAVLGFCGVYFAIQLTIYAVTFWLPTIIKEMLATPGPHGGLLGVTEDFVRWLGYTEPKAVAVMSAGFLNSLPWIVSVFGMIAAAYAAARWKNQQAWVATALVIAGLGMLVAGHSTPAVAFGAICFAALGFKSAASLFWPIPQQNLDPRIAAAGIALINSLGNLGGWAAPIGFGWIKQSTGSVYGGLYGLAFTSLLTAALVFFTRPKAKA
ncbi:MAG: MFS transporter [Opitutales bacterium]|jgi:MFS family permease